MGKRSGVRVSQCLSNTRTSDRKEDEESLLPEGARKREKQL